MGWWRDASGYTIAAGAIVVAALGLVAELAAPPPGGARSVRGADLVSLDDPVRQQQHRRRNREAELLGGLEVDD